MDQLPRSRFVLIPRIYQLRNVYQLLMRWMGIVGGEAEKLLKFSETDISIIAFHSAGIFYNAELRDNCSQLFETGFMSCQRKVPFWNFGICAQVKIQFND